MSYYPKLIQLMKLHDWYSDPTPSSSDTPSPPRPVTANNTSLITQQISHIAIPTQQPLPTAPSTPQGPFHGHATFTQDSQLASANQQLPALETQAQFPAIIVPPLPSDARPSDYIPVQDDLSSRKRKRGNGTSYATSATQTRDQRAAADEASSRLSEIVQDILEAEDQLPPHTVTQDQASNAMFFVSTISEHGDGRTLALAAQVKLEAALHKSMTFGRLSDISAETLSRLQRLCEGALASAESSEFGIEASWNDEDFLHWSVKLEDVDLGLRSARTILRIMTGEREEKELYSEEILQSVIRLLDKVLKTCIIPVVEARNNESNSVFFQSATLHKKVLSQLLHDTTKVMSLLADLLAKVDMAENIINAAEFFATHTLFVENAFMEKDSILGIQKFETLRRTSMDMITEIFSRYPEQRVSIFDEVLTSLQKLPTTRQQARQFKLAAGINIQLVTALILRLVQISARRTLPKKSKDRGPELLLSDGESRSGTSHYDEKYSSESSNDGAGSHNRKRVQELTKLANLMCDAAGKSAQYVVRFFVSRAMTAPKTGDQPHRHLLDMFCEDLIAVLNQPEWPAAELLLRALLVHMVEIVEKPKFNAPAKNMALELLGLMGSAITDLVDSTRKAARSLDNDESEFSGYLRQLLDDYMNGALESDEVLSWQGPYRAVIECLQPNEVDDSQLESAQVYYLAQWAKAVAVGNLQAGPKVDKLVNQLRRSLLASEWITSEYVPSVGMFTMILMGLIVIPRQFQAFRVA